MDYSLLIGIVDGSREKKKKKSEKVSTLDSPNEIKDHIEVPGTEKVSRWDGGVLCETDRIIVGIIDISQYYGRKKRYIHKFKSIPYNKVSNDDKSKFPCTNSTIKEHISTVDPMSYAIRFQKFLEDILI